jgi:hypothetical protein
MVSAADGINSAALRFAAATAAPDRPRFGRVEAEEKLTAGSYVDHGETAISRMMSNTTGSTCMPDVQERRLAPSAILVECEQAR